MKYLKTQDAPKAVMDALEELGSEQQESWKRTLKQIEELLEE